MGMTILIVDDHPLFRQGLAGLIGESFPGSRILEAGSADEARRIRAETVVTHLILDISLPGEDGISLARSILKRDGAPVIFILTMHDQSSLLWEARRIGCRGYFLKDGSGESLVDAIRTASDEFLVSPGLSYYLKQEVPELSSDFERYAGLTRREKEIFRMLIQGLGYKEVAFRLNISPRTSSVHRYNIFRKLRIGSDVEMVNLARNVGLTP